MDEEEETLQDEFGRVLDETIEQRLGPDADDTEVRLVRPNRCVVLRSINIEANCFSVKKWCEQMSSQQDTLTKESFCTPDLNGH